MTPTKLRGAALRLGTFAAAAALVFATILATIRPWEVGGDARTFTAEFTSASDLAPGDDVRVAGVRAGEVEEVTVSADGLARVSFDLDAKVQLTTGSTVEIRYLDLAGNRYLAVERGRRGSPPQPEADLIGVDRTAPALDVNDLVAGFKPLLVGLSAEDVNDLSLQIVQTLQGDGASIRHLISRTASLTTGLARRDDLIRQVVDNLGSAVTTVSSHHRELEQLIRELRRLAEGLAGDRGDIGRAIAHVDEMTRLTAGLLRETRPEVRDDIAHLGEVARTLSSPTGRREVDHALDHLPSKLEELAATAGYGSWFNYYVCGVRVSVDPAARRADPGLAALLEKVHVVDTAKRCAE